MSSSISGLHYEENQIGGAFKSSKIEYIWEFILNGTSPNKIELIYSKWTGKKRLLKNGVEVFDKNNDGSFLKNFEIDGHIFSIMQYGEKCELRVDNQSFTHLYNLEKNKNFFTGEDDPTSKTQIAKSYTDNLSSENDENNLYKYKENEKKEEKPGLFDFKIKVDESKQNSGLKKFKFGPGIKTSNSAFDKNKKTENNTNNDLLGFGDIIQNDTNNNINNNLNSNNNDIFGFEITNNDSDKKNDTNINNNTNDLFNFGNTNNNKNNTDFLNFGSNTDNNNNINQNSNSKTTNEQLADVFSAFTQSNNQINETKEKNQDNNVENIEQENKENNNSNNNFFTFNPSSVNQTNFFNQNQDFMNNENNNNFGFFNPEQKEENKTNNENGEVNYPKLEEINNQDNNNNDNNAFTFNFVPQESNNFNNIEGFKPTTGFDYDAFNKAQKNEPSTNNDKLDNALQNLF